jgi:hypothetical protein
MPSGISEALHDLIKSGNADNEPAVLSRETFVTIDIFPHFAHLFTPKALETLNNQTNSVLHQYNEVVKDPPNNLKSLLTKLGLKSTIDKVDWVRKADLVHFFGSTAKEEDLAKAIEKVILAVNEVADKGFTKVSLLKLSVIPFAAQPDMEREFAVVSYISLDKAGEEYVENNLKNMVFPEGGVPVKVEQQ